MNANGPSLQSPLYVTPAMDGRLPSAVWRVVWEVVSNHDFRFPSHADGGSCRGWRRRADGTIGTGRAIPSHVETVLPEETGRVLAWAFGEVATVLGYSYVTEQLTRW